MEDNEKIKQLKTFYSLPENQQKAIMLLFSGKQTQGRIAENVGVARVTLTLWRQKDKFRKAQDEYNRFMLRDLTNEAILTMRDLLNSRSEMVRFNAAKDILDRSMSYEQTRKIKADAELAELRVKQADGSADSQVVVNVHLPEDGDSNG
ncbi:terminase small subunit [Lactobacillus phage phiJL-1]|uniref:Small subunit terminase n=1 Tax=Lactobacillus phage phiJL-1 TaxID=2892345 RepID=Q597W0_9CAUD|nr:terminase small subunit [Lactobacillus phage phiJL-1]AAP74511.1 putative small subunit terminase [Lactobacillus phage phiJL-1]